MVKQLDDIDDPDGPDHIGIRLWRAQDAWTTDFIRRMNEAGHHWFTPARANLLGCVDRRGTRQSDLIERLAISKQAVQQLIDGLVTEGVLERVPDPDDGRGRIVRYTPRGAEAIADADRIKRQIETDMRRKMGDRAFETLFDLLAQVPGSD